MHTGKPAQNAHAPVIVTMRPTTVNKKTQINSAKTKREKVDRREYFMFSIPAFANKKGIQRTRWPQTKTTAQHNRNASLRSILQKADI